MGSEIKRIDGFRSRGGEKPYLNPMEVGIVGLTHSDRERDVDPACDRPQLVRPGSARRRGA